MMSDVTPDRIMEMGTAFFGSKTLLTAVGMGLFTTLAARGSMTQFEIEREFDLDGRGADDFLDALVALGFLEREDEQYWNAEESEIFLDKNKPSYIGGILEMADERLYRFWDDLPTALRTGEPQNEVEGNKDTFSLPAVPQRSPKPIRLGIVR